MSKLTIVLIEDTANKLFKKTLSMGVMTILNMSTDTNTVTLQDTTGGNRKPGKKPGFLLFEAIY